MLKRLAAFQRQNQLDFALQELGRIGRTLFLLDWLESPDLRQLGQAGLNKSEQRHSLAPSDLYRQARRIADCCPDAQQFRASGLNMAIAAIVYWDFDLPGRRYRPPPCRLGRAARPYLTAYLGAHRLLPRLLMGPGGRHGRATSTAEPQPRKNGRVTRSSVHGAFPLSVVQMTADAHDRWERTQTDRGNTTGKIGYQYGTTSGCKRNACGSAIFWINSRMTF